MSEEEGSKMDVDTPVEEEKKIDLNVNPSASADSASKHPNMALAQDIHRLVMSTGPKALISNAEDLSAAGISPELNAKVLKKVVSDIENPSLYRHLQPILNWSSLSDKELDEMDSKHVETLKELEDKVEKSRESAGDMEVLESRFEVARFSAKSLSKDEAFEAYDKVLALPKLSSGKTIDALMEQSRVSSFHGDMQKYSKLIERAVKLAGDGGDWDRRNRLKVYNAFSKIADRDLKTAASLLVDCIATFSCDELCTYTDFVVYTIITNILYLPRTELKEKIIDGPEIISIINEIPIVSKLMKSLYSCDYTAYLNALVELQPILLADRYFKPHAGYIVRELHVLGYKQFLDSYKSVTLESMASSFGIGTQFLDIQLSRFIAAGRLSAKIDKYGGVVETNRPDLKNAQYRDMIQKGDLLLNRIQKLARVVDL